MEEKNAILGKLKKAVKKDYLYISYNLPHYEEDYKKGILKVDGETIETPAYSFTEISDIVKKPFKELYKVKSVEQIGFRGETLVADEKTWRFTRQELLG